MPPAGGSRELFMNHMSTSAAAPRPSLKGQTWSDNAYAERINWCSLYTPNNQRLATTTIPCGKNALHTGQVFLVGCSNIRTRVLAHAKCLDYFWLWAQETKSQKHELRGEVLRRARRLLHFPAPTTVLCPFDAD